ncbi:hypothetical protein GJ744_011115 [Endocarpon pusillum]|uniref:Uncharacterized protein n=1 Tax=Endocarpon pusillum TaxID=364733 RepID=A0A8H7E1A1_9EURO|nr:hypothetical protein GJ744_011115 [Endocarpon pusillum]
MLASRTVSSIARRLPLKAKPLANRSFSVAATRGMVLPQVIPLPPAITPDLEGFLPIKAANAFSLTMQPGDTTSSPARRKEK